MDFKNEEDLMGYLKRQVLAFKAGNAEGLIPHLVMSHGFMEWSRLLGESFRSMAWRGQEQEAVDEIVFIEYMSMLFKRFWIRLMEEKMGLGVKQRGYLLVEGWKEFLKD